MASIHELRAKAHEIDNRAHAEITGLADNAPASEAESVNERVNAMITEAQALRARADTLEAIEARTAAFTAADPRRPLHDGEARASKSGDDYDTAFEALIRYGADRLSAEHRSILNRGEVRDGQVVGTANLGGNTVPTSIASAVIVAAKAYGPFNDRGACNYIVTDNGAPMVFPTMDDTGNIGSMIAEATAASVANVVLGNIALNAYKATTGVFKFSSELISDSAVDFKTLVSTAAGERVGRLVNLKATKGSGSGEPSGLITALGSPTNVTASANALVWDDALATYHAVDPAYRDGPQVGWMLNDSTLLALRKLKDSMGRYLFEPGLTVGDPGTIYGKTYKINQNMDSIATGNIPLVFGDFSKFTIRISRSMAMLQQLNELFAASDQVGFVGFLRFDSNLMDPRAIKGLKVS